MSAINYQTFCHAAPDKFLENAVLMLDVEFPRHELTGNISEKLTRDMWQTFVTNKQTVHNFCSKMNLWKQLNKYIKSTFPHYGLFMGGSTLNGFGLKDSDVDMSLLDETSHLTDRHIAIPRLARLLESLKKYEYIDCIQLIEALVPLIKFHESQYNLNVDINYNMSVNIRNSHLLYCYSQVDWRVTPLVLVIKLWAKSQDINNAKYGTISSYSLILMVIHFLQCGVNPAILPCLQILFKEKFKPDCDIQSINFFEKLDIPFHAFVSLNRQTLGELLIGFFKYYDSFEFANYAISVRLGQKIPRLGYLMEQLHKGIFIQWKCMCIEEPFTLTNVSRSVYDPATFRLIQRVIQKTYKELSTTRDLSRILKKL